LDLTIDQDKQTLAIHQDIWPLGKSDL
jgi:hypothetical protein